jgi:hypothetical protein
MKITVLLALFGCISAQSNETDSNNTTAIAEMNIWEDEIEELSICANPNSRWAHSSNNFGVYKKMLSQSTQKFVDQGFPSDMEMVFSTSNPPKPGRVSEYK